MADVLRTLTAFHSALAVVLALKAIDTAVRFGWLAAAGFAVAAIGVARQKRWGVALILPLAGWLFVGGGASNHLVLLATTATAVLAFPDQRDRQVAFVAILSGMYLFAGAAKVNPRWISGADLAVWLPWMPAPTLAAYGTIVAELLLGVIVWIGPIRRPAAWMATAVHLSIAAGMSLTWEAAPSIWAFNLLPVAMWWWTVTPPRPPSSPDPSRWSTTRHPQGYVP